MDYRCLGHFNTQLSTCHGTFQTHFLYLSVPQMLNDPRMHRASTSTNVPPPQQTRHDFNTPPPPSGMEGRRNSISSNTKLGI